MKGTGREAIRIKPHHFVDIISALGRGQTAFEPHPYGHAVHTVTVRLLEAPESLLEIELGADDVCRPCIHNVGGECDDTIDTSYRPEASSSKQEYNLLVDERWCERLRLRQGQRLDARQFCRRLRQCAGDIGEIYREMPADRVAKRAEELRAGVEKFLAAGGSNELH
ncbi:MAG: hypothetical protein ABIP48_05790 [Planctomycetota bacterium]